MGDTIHIGLVNNMPDAALRATELQFARLLKDAPGDFDVRLHLFAIPSVRRSEMAMSRMEGSYVSTDNLPSSGVDALIVTGAEPLAAKLRDEPYWSDFTRLTDWAREGTLSTIFSCLASHAAVLHLDSITRTPLPQKLSGIFSCECVETDPLMSGIRSPFIVPHSRLNGLFESELVARKYKIVSRFDNRDVNIFWRNCPSDFIFLQGHPEYDSATLGREYLRDLGRFLRGESDVPPGVPENYFDRATRDALGMLAGDRRDPELLAQYADIIGRSRLTNTWRNHTLAFFGNWLGLIARSKARLRTCHFNETMSRRTARVSEAG